MIFLPYSRQSRTALKTALFRRRRHQRTSGDMLRHERKLKQLARRDARTGNCYATREEHVP